MIRISSGRPPEQPPARHGLAEWSARTYGPGWTETRQRYWASTARWRRRRCFWCRRGQPGTRWASRRRLQLNHLTYRLSDNTGRCPLWALRPMCPTCHGIETWLTRRYDPGRKQPWAHAIVTYAVRWAMYVPMWASAAYVII